MRVGSLVTDGHYRQEIVMSDSSTDAVARMVEALGDPDWLYDGGQLAFLMSRAMAWGYDLGLAEQVPSELAYGRGWSAGFDDALAEMTAARPVYPPRPHVIVAGVLMRHSQAEARAIAAADRTERWSGGTAEEAREAFMWDADRPDHVPGTGRLYVRAWAGSVVWDEGRIAASAASR